MGEDAQLAIYNVQIDNFTWWSEQGLNLRLRISFPAL